LLLPAGYFFWPVPGVWPYNWTFPPWDGPLGKVPFTRSLAIFPTPPENSGTALMTIAFVVRREGVDSRANPSRPPLVPGPLATE